MICYSHSLFLVCSHVKGEILAAKKYRLKLEVSLFERILSVIVRKKRAIAKYRGRPFTFMFSHYESYLKRLTTMTFGEVAVRFSSRYHYFEILGPPAT